MTAASRRRAGCDGEDRTIVEQWQHHDHHRSIDSVKKKRMRSASAPRQIP
jgi:hypothetical protein